MAVAVKKIKLWRTEVENRPGALASTLEPLAQAGADLKIVMGYRLGQASDRAAIEVHPVAGKKVAGAAQRSGMSVVPMSTLLVEGDDRPGLGHALAQAIGEAGVNMAFMLAQVIGRKYSAVLAFDNDADATKAAALIKKAAVAKRKS
jgi:hypothetical protein